MVEVNIIYQGELRCEATHAPSGNRLLTDAPLDNQGKAETFSPTDLVATALGSCILTVMGIAARKLNIDIAGSTVKVIKEMVAKPVRRIGSLKVTVTVPTKLDAAQKEALKAAALSCPVHQSLHPDIAMPIEFIWAD